MALSFLLLPSSVGAADSEFVQACEQKLFRALPFPELYERTTIRETVRVLTRDDVLAQLKSSEIAAEKIPGILKKYDDGRFRPVEATLIIDFTLPDKQAVVLNRRIVCELRKQHPSERLNIDFVIIDGLMLDVDLAQKFGKRR